LIGAGGFAGAILRYWIGGWFQRLPIAESFPLGTLVVNVSGCLLFGILAEVAEVRGLLTAEMRQLLLIGVLGAYTTFSSFANDSVHLLRDGKQWFAVLNVAASLLLCLLALWLGRALARELWD
jgi:CrcB protein